MPPRSYVASSRRPLSAIFLGSLPPKDPKEASIPALPEPPESPGAAPPSGLPSPPATNSTGSGSAGDNNSANSGSIRQRPISYSASSSTTMPTEMHDKSIVVSKTSRPNSDDEDDENDHAPEEDVTARLDRRIGDKSPSENIAALQRVKSLAQRNRMALDKLSSRLNTPSPTFTSRSPYAPSSSTSTSSSSRLSSHSHSHSMPQVQRSDTLSGSETERESLRAPTPSNSNSYRSSSPERPLTPPSASDSRIQRKLTSAPTSPEKARQASPGPSRTPRKRVSIASAISVQGIESGRYSINDHDVTEVALAAVASSRRSPTSNKKSRQPLPREFRDRERHGRGSIEFMTPHQTTFRDDVYDDDQPRTAAHTAVNTTNQYSPRGPRSTRFSTVRELTRRHQTRWLSDDISGTDSGRRQSQRGGSAESALNGSVGVTGRLAGESLRAAGIGMRGSVRQASTNEDVFDGRRDFHASARVAHSSMVGASTSRTVEWGDGERRRRSVLDDGGRGTGSSARTGVSDGPPVSRPHLHSDPTRASVLERDPRATGHGLSSRPATSMADFLHGEDGLKGGSYSIRSRRATYDLSDRQEPRHSPSMRTVSLAPTPSNPRAGTPHHRASLTPSSNGPLINLNSPQNAEHTRLMLESLSMFSSQLSRLPNQSQTVRDVSDHSTAIIRSSERLNRILRARTANAVQQQIAIEVDDEYNDADGSNDPAQIWRDVGSDFREGLRESDDVVRSLTGFILGVGKLLKEVAGAPDSAHLRSISLNDEATRCPSSDTGSGRRSQDGRRSVESRLSWEPLISTGGADMSRRLTSRSELNLARPPSSRDRDRASDQDRSTSRNGLKPPPTARRLFTPREHREHQMTSDVSPVFNTSNVLDLSLDHEPSPTPVSRYPLAERARPPLYSTPPPLPSLPSESLLQRSKTTVEKSSRRNVSLASINTVRTPNGPFALSTPNPTTAVTTHTASASAEISTFPLERSESRDSIRSSVTFSRPSGVSVSSLQQQQNRDEARRRVGPATDEGDPSGLNQIRPPLSGSETERDTRRRTIGVRAARMSLEATVDEPEASGGNPQPKTITFPSQRRERRRTVTEIFG